MGDRSEPARRQLAGGKTAYEAWQTGKQDMAFH